MIQCILYHDRDIGKLYENSEKEQSGVRGAGSTQGRNKGARAGGKANKGRHQCELRAALCCWTDTKALVCHCLERSTGRRHSQLCTCQK